MSLHFGCLEVNEEVVVAPSSSRAAFACGGAGESSVHGGRRPQFFLCPHFPSRDNDACCWHRERCIRNCSVHSPPVPGTSIEPPCSCRRSWFSGRGVVGVGVQRRDGYIVSRGGGMPQQQQQQWSRGGSSHCNTGLATVVCRGSSSCRTTGLATVACRGNSSRSSTGFAVVSCRGSSSNSSCNTGLATVACRGSSSRSSNDLAVVACRDSSINSSSGLAAVGFLTSTNVGPMLSFPPSRRDTSNRCSNRHESLRSEVTGRTDVAPYPKLYLAVMAGLFRNGFRRKLWRCRCSIC